MGVSEHIRTQRDGAVLKIEIDRPQKRNALTRAMYSALSDAIEAAEGDETIRVLLLTGGPSCFTAGNDLNDFLDSPPGREESPAGRFLRVISTAEKPIVAAVAGVAVGVGTTLLLHCDLIYAADSAVFQLPFVNMALVPEAGSTLLLPILSGFARSSELLLLGERFGAAEAERLGLVNRVLPESELGDYALSRAFALAQQPPGAVRLTKSLMRRATAPALAQRMQEEGDAFVDQLQSPEAVEAMRAFVEKRPADFSKLR